jgi:transcription antitermination factor NusG
MTDGSITTSTECSEGWFVVWTESRAEKRVESRIAALGLEPWLPKVTERRKWSDRWREVVFPLFPGYLFARGRIAHLSSILRTPGVVSVVKIGTRPALLADGFINSLRHAIESSGVTPTPVTEQVDYAVQDEVIVREGPLAGLRGIVQEVRSGRRLVVWITHIGRGVAFTIGSALVSRAPNALAR